MLNIPEEEKTCLEALTGLLEALGEAGIQSQVSEIRLEPTYLVARYAGRFDVKMALNDDFAYNVRLMQSVRREMEAKDGENTSGSMDLTRTPVVYSPAQGQQSPP